MADEKKVLIDTAIMDAPAGLEPATVTPEELSELKEKGVIATMEGEPLPDLTQEFTKVISGGREVHWRLVSDGVYEAHNGDGRVTSPQPWARFQSYLDGQSGFPG